MRLIDADALLDKVQDYGEGQERLMLIDPYWIQKAPTVERPHGEWIKHFDVKTQYYTCTCSVCGDTHRLLINYFLESNFCPNCGADMREGEAE